MGLVGFVLWLVFAVAQFFAFSDGARDWWHFGTIGIALTFVVCLVLGPLGGLVMAVVGFHGATAVWGWPWWQALLLVAPGLVFSVIATGVSGLGGIVSMVARSSKRP